jgi:hypothetical protein
MAVWPLVFLMRAFLRRGQLAQGGVHGNLTRNRVGHEPPVARNAAWPLGWPSADPLRMRVTLEYLCSGARRLL